MILKKIFTLVIFGAFFLNFSTSVLASETECVIKATDIEIGSYEPQMNVGSTQSLTVTVLPSDSTENIVSYTSSDESVATVSDSGEIKGISKGTALIGIAAGDIKKEITITVKVATKAVSLNTDYLVLKPTVTFGITATVSPTDANQAVSYKSINPSIASVSNQGVLKALSIGTTSVIVSNGDMSSVITVIVNENGYSMGRENQDPEKALSPDALSEQEANLINIIKSGSDQIVINSNDYNILSKNILKELFNTGKTLMLKKESYNLVIDGNNIVNYNNELMTDIEFKQEKNGVTFFLNDGNRLPGKVTIELSDALEGNYLYIYNDVKKQYQKLGLNNKRVLNLDESGKYLLADKELDTLKINPVYIIIGGIALLLVGIIYVIVKRRYWFW